MIARRSYPRRVSEKRLKANGGKMFSTITSKPKAIRQVNPAAKARRDARYRKVISSPRWKALRREKWDLMLKKFGVVRCASCGKRIEWLSGAHLGHRTYARFGHELIDDVEIDCPPCNQTEAALRGKRIRRTV